MNGLYLYIYIIFIFILYIYTYFYIHGTLCIFVLSEFLSEKSAFTSSPSSSSFSDWDGLEMFGIRLDKIRKSIGAFSADDRIAFTLETTPAESARLNTQTFEQILERATFSTLGHSYAALCAMLCQKCRLFLSLLVLIEFFELRQRSISFICNASGHSAGHLAFANVAVSGIKKIQESKRWDFRYLTYSWRKMHCRGTVGSLMFKG